MSTARNVRRMFIRTVAFVILNPLIHTVRWCEVRPDAKFVAVRSLPVRRHWAISSRPTVQNCWHLPRVHRSTARRVRRVSIRTVAIVILDSRRRFFFGPRDSETKPYASHIAGRPCAGVPKNRRQWKRAGRALVFRMISRHQFGRAGHALTFRMISRRLLSGQAVRWRSRMIPRRQ